MIHALLVSALSSILAPARAFAGASLPSAADAIGTVGGGTLSATIDGSTQAGDILGSSISSLLPLVNGVAILILIITGFIMVISQDENALGTGRKVLIAVLSAMVLINLALPIRLAFVDIGEGNTTIGATLLSSEALGVVRFLETLLGSLAIVMILVSGIRAIITFGTDQGAANIRRTVMSVLAGVVLVISRFVITRSIGATNQDVSGITNGFNDAGHIIGEGLDIITVILGFMGLAALVVIIIAGIILVVNKGDQETATRARNLVIRTLIGLAIIIMSAALVNLVIT